MSSMTHKLTRPLALAALLIGTATPALAQDLMTRSTTPAVAATSDAALSFAVAEWTALRQTDALPFSSYARFLVAHPGWPGEVAMRKSAERALRPDGEDPTLVAAYFTRNPPSTATAGLRFAEALDATGRRDQARDAARRAWAMGTLSADDEARMLARFGTALTSADHDARADRLLWSRVTPAAARQVTFASPTRQPVFGTRVALQQRSVDAASRLGYLGDASRTDAGLIADRVTWLRVTGQEASARMLLASPRALAAPPLDAERWFETLLGVARAAAADGQSQLAYDIARQVDDAYAPGTVVRDRALGERDEYTNLTWLAGTTALNRLGRPADAIGMFDRYARAARSPQTQSKGLYWAGRAAEAAGRRSEATAFYERAALHYDQFHGQLATERLARVPALAPATTRIEVSKNQRDAYYSSEIVRAAQLLGSRGDWQNQTQFVRQIAQAAATPVDHVLGVELAQRMARTDLGVMIGRSAGINGYRDYVRAGFPTVALPAEAQSSWTMAHAIMRQESQFDRAAISHAGARGLMQLMPGTAREVAGRIGLGYDTTALTQDTQYNIKLGSDYFGQMMSRFGGSYVLSVAAYNAGPGNVNKWLRANGDPRLPGVDVLQWIEAIPLSETRGYVQRVLENAVVYDLIEPSRARMRSRTPLSAYLGKTTAG